MQWTQQHVLRNVMIGIKDNPNLMNVIVLILLMRPYRLLVVILSVILNVLIAEAMRKELVVLLIVNV